MARVIDSLREHLAQSRTPGERAGDWLLFGLFLAGTAYLLLKTWLVSEQAEYDFRIIWLAGEAWIRGINPYSPEYHELGKRIISQGYVPILWVYPPNWFLPTLLLTVADVDTASVLWNIANVALIVASSALLAASCAPVRFENAPRHSAFGALRRQLRTPWNVFFLHVWALAVLQPVALTLSVGQTSILIYFGVCLLIYGLARERGLTAVLGLAIVFLKPQLGAVIVVALIMRREHHMLVAKAVAVSAVVSLPALVVTPTAAFDFLVNITRYDAMHTANWPHSMTGIRHLIWSLSGADPGNMAAMAAALTIMAGLCLMFARMRPQPTGVELVVMASAITLGIAPLHLYDMMLVGVLLFALAESRPFDMAVGALGAALLWRADDLARLTGFYDAETQHFVGSRLATVGALLIMIAVFQTIRRRSADTPA